MSWFQDLLIKLGGGEPEPKPDTVEFFGKPVESRSSGSVSREKALEGIYAATITADQIYSGRDELEAQRRLERRYQNNPYRNVPAYDGWNTRPKNPDGALPIVFDAKNMKIPDEDVISWGGEKYRRVLVYRNKYGDHQYTVVDEVEFLRWKNRQKENPDG